MKYAVVILAIALLVRNKTVHLVFSEYFVVWSRLNIVLLFSLLLWPTQSQRLIPNQLLIHMHYGSVAANGRQAKDHLELTV